MKALSVRNPWATLIAQVVTAFCKGVKNMLIVHERWVKYKILTLNLTSLGLNGAKTIPYLVSGWTDPGEPVRRGPCGRGGLWVAHTLRQATQLQALMMRRRRLRTRIYMCVVGVTLYETSRRIKTDRVKLLCTT